MVALFCTFSHQYFDCVVFKGESSCRFAFHYAWRNIILIFVLEEFVDRKLLYAHLLLSFPVELYSMFP